MSETLVPIQMPVGAAAVGPQPAMGSGAPAIGAGAFLTMLDAVIAGGKPPAEGAGTPAASPLSPAAPAVPAGTKAKQPAASPLPKPLIPGKAVSPPVQPSEAPGDGEETAEGEAGETGQRQPAAGDPNPLLPDVRAEQAAVMPETASAEDAAVGGQAEIPPPSTLLAAAAAPAPATAPTERPEAAAAAVPVAAKPVRTGPKPEVKAEAGPAKAPEGAETREAKAPAQDGRPQPPASETQRTPPPTAKPPAARPEAQASTVAPTPDAPPPASEAVSTNLSTLQQIDAETIALPRQAVPAQPGQQPVPGQPAPAARPDIPALGLQIAAEARGGNTRFEIELDPPELGRIDVRIEVSRDGRVTTHMTVDRPETLDALLRDSRGLERALQSAGLKLEDGGVQYQLRDQSSFTQQERHSGAREHGHGNPPEQPDQDAHPANEPQIDVYRRRLSPGAVDIRI